jgi:RNA-splicing ligase RtcB
LSLQLSAYDFFFKVLETHETLLHAETQAIAAQHLETIESILAQKDESLKNLLDAKNDIGIDPRENQKADELIDRVIALQKRNTESFKKLHEKQSSKASSENQVVLKPIDHRVREAYSRSIIIPKSRLGY